MKTQNSNSKNFGEFVLDFDKEADSFCLIAPNIPIKVSGFGKNGNFEYIVGYRCQNTSTFFETPVDSSLLGIFCYENLSTDPEFFDMSRVETKYLRIPFGTQFVLIPIIHSSFLSFTQI